MIIGLGSRLSPGRFCGGVPGLLLFPHGTSIAECIASAALNAGTVFSAGSAKRLAPDPTSQASLSCFFPRRWAEERVVRHDLHETTAALEAEVLWIDV